MQITPHEQILISKHPDVSVAVLRSIAVTVDELIAVEREACAKIAAEPPPLGGPNHGAWDRGYLDGRTAAAAAIRNRSI